MATQTPTLAPTTANEVLILFSQALSQAPDSESQAEILSRVREAIDRDPTFIPVLYSTILSVASSRASSSAVLKRWIADTVEFVVSRMGVISNALTPDQRIHMTLQSLDAILLFLEDRDIEVHKLGIQCFAAAYPLVFRHACGTGSDPRQWEKALRGKAVCLNAWRNGPTGAKVVGMKCVQKIVQAQTRVSMDPRLQNRGDINVGMCPSHHPFLRAQELEAEANKLVEEAFSLLYTARIPDIVSSVINGFVILVKARPTLSHLIFGAFTNWTPQALSSLTFTQVRSVEKTLRLALVHLLRSGHANAYAAQINDALHRQDQRMKTSADQEHRRKEQEASLKRQRVNDEVASSSSLAASDSLKRRKLEDGSALINGTPPPQSTSTTLSSTANPLGLSRQSLLPLINALSNASGGPPVPGIADFDISALPVNLVLELVMANLQVIREEALAAAIERARASLPPQLQASAPAAMDGVALDRAATEEGGPETDASSLERLPAVKIEETVAMDPLNVELDEDDLEGRAIAARIQQKQNAAELAAAEAEAEAALLAGSSSGGRAAGGAAGRERSGTAETTLSRQASAEASSSSIPASSTASSAAAPLKIVSTKLKSKLLHSAVTRICTVGMSSMAVVQAGGGDKDLWIQLISRLATRGFTDVESGAGGGGNTGGAAPGFSSESDFVRKEKNAIRRQIFDFVTADLAERIELARLWLNEEWYTQEQDESSAAEKPEAQIRPYSLWLQKLLDFIANSTQEKGSAFTQFFVDLPHIPKRELQRLVKMCTDPSGMKVGFMTLRDLATLRPPLRSDAMDVLLSLTTHADRSTRGAAILTIKRWVPDTKPLAQMSLDFATLLLGRLADPPSPIKADAGVMGKQQENGTTTGSSSTPAGTPSETPATNGAPHSSTENPESDSVTMASVENGEIVGNFPYPTTEAQVAQHIELLLGLVTKAPHLLAELFKAYPKMAPSVQQAIESLFTPLIRVLGPSNPSILSTVQACPPGAEDLVLRILTILTEKGKLPGPLTSVIKTTAQEKDLSPRFMVPIIADLNKQEIMRHLPRIVSLLNGRQSERDLIRSVFQSVVTTPPQNFGFTSTNVPRVRQSELLTPVELMVLLHQSEKEIGIKQSIEAIGICFSMTEAFRPEVLGAFMQQIVDETTLPTLFMRTVIKAVTTYKSLQPYVSNTLLSRLITKKIWTLPQLWQGFIKCATAIAPASFGAILQLPREQIKELVGKQPDLREGLKDYLIKKAGPNKSRIAGTLEILDSATATATATAAAA